MFSKLIAPATLIFFCSANAFGATPNQRIFSLCLCTVPLTINHLAVYREEASDGVSGSIEKLKDGIAKGHDCNKSHLPDAIAAAGNNADLKQAIKTFYLKSEALLDSQLDSSKMARDRAEREQSEALDALSMKLN